MDGNPCSLVLILGSRSVQQFYGNHLVGNYGSADKSQAACSLEDSPATLDHRKCMIRCNKTVSSTTSKNLVMAMLISRQDKHLLRHANWSSSLGDVIRIS